VFHGVIRPEGGVDASKITPISGFLNARK
jgi:hypothetical protein